MFSVADMACVAITCNGEGISSVVAGATRFTVFHVIHADRIITGAWLEEISVTIRTTEHIGVDVMAEHGSTHFFFLEWNVASRVAG